MVSNDVGGQGPLLAGRAKRLWNCPPVRGLALGAVSGALCGSPLVFYLNPFMYLGWALERTSEFVSAQLAFSGPGLVFGAAFWVLARRIQPVAARSGVLLVLGTVAVWLTVLNLGMQLLDVSGPPQLWIGPFCAGLGGLLELLLAMSLLAALRDLRYLLSATALTTLAGFIPVEWTNLMPEFEPTWLALFVAWQCAMLVSAGYFARSAQAGSV